MYMDFNRVVQTGCQLVKIRCSQAGRQTDMHTQTSMHRCHAIHTYIQTIMHTATRTDKQTKNKIQQGIQIQGLWQWQTERNKQTVHRQTYKQNHPGPLKDIQLDRDGDIQQYRHTNRDKHK